MTYALINPPGDNNTHRNVISTDRNFGFGYRYFEYLIKAMYFLCVHDQASSRNKHFIFNIQEFTKN